MTFEIGDTVRLTGKIVQTDDHRIEVDAGTSGTVIVFSDDLELVEKAPSKFVDGDVVIFENRFNKKVREVWGRKKGEWIVLTSSFMRTRDDKAITEVIEFEESGEGNFKVIKLCANY